MGEEMDIGGITTREVRRTLCRYGSARPVKGSRLLEMNALQLRLRSEGIALSDESLEWVLGVLLHEIICRRLRDLRSARGLPARATSHREQSLIESDFRQGCTELEAWSSLYYRFLCPSLLLKTGELAAIALPSHQNRSGERLIQRRMRRALTELTDVLRRLEHAAARLDTRTARSTDSREDARSTAGCPTLSRQHALRQLVV